MRPWSNLDGAIAALSVGGIAAHLALTAAGAAGYARVPLLVVLVLGGTPLVGRLAVNAARGTFGADFLAAVSIVAASFLGEFLAGAIIVLMLSGGEALERYAVAQAGAVLRALAARLPIHAHRRRGGVMEDIAVSDVRPDDEIAILPHEICPVDGVVIDGHGQMDESYLTGEPFQLTKAPGASVLSGAVNGDMAIVIRATRVAADSRYAQIMRVMQEAEQRRPTLRRLGDQLGAWYTPLALTIASVTWAVSGDPIRFLSVVVVATPCPLLIAIPVAIIGAISTAARRGIIIRDPAALEQLTLCRTMILDKTGTLTYGRPALTADVYGPGFSRERVMPLVATLERYSRHPLALPIVEAAGHAGLALPPVEWVREEPGAGLRGSVAGHVVSITSRAHASALVALPPAPSTGLECIVLVDNQFAGALSFHDTARAESRGFIDHLRPRHGVSRVLIVSGDREAEVRRLADTVAIGEVRADMSPEQKLTIVRAETSRGKTVYIGDGLNDAPALMAATVGIAFGQHSDVTSEAARIVIVDSSLSKVDELMHISYRLRQVALQSAAGGMLLSVIGMGFAAAGWMGPVAGAVAQEAIDVAAVLNALRTARVPRSLTDF